MTINVFRPADLAKEEKLPVVSPCPGSVTVKIENANT